MELRHRTFQEYLAAKALARSEGRAYLAALRSRLYDPGYAEIWRLLAGELSVIQQRSEAAAGLVCWIYRDTHPLHARLMRKNLLLAAGCLSDSVVTDEDLSEAVASDLVELVLSSAPVPPSEIVESTLRQLGGTPQAIRCVRLLSPSLSGKSAHVRAAAVSTLAALGARDEIGRIVGLLKDRSWRVRWRAVKSLADLGAKEEIGRIAELLNDRNDFVRFQALEALANLGTKEEVWQVVELLNDTSSFVRTAAVKAQGEKGAKEDVGRIVELLKHQIDEVRATTVTMLVSLGAKEEIGRIVSLLNDRNEHVRARAVTALASLGGGEARQWVEEGLNDKSRSVLVTAMKALATLGTKRKLVESWQC